MQVDIDLIQALDGCAGQPAHFFAGQIGDFYVIPARGAGIEQEAGCIAGGIGVSIERRGRNVCIYFYDGAIGIVAVDVDHLQAVKIIAFYRIVIREAVSVVAGGGSGGDRTDRAEEEVVAGSLYDELPGVYFVGRLPLQVYGTTL